MKTCYRCKTSKPESDFSKDCQKPDGLRSWCKTCMRIYMIEKSYVSKPKANGIQVDTSDMILVGTSSRCDYYLDKTGIIYRKYPNFCKEVVKRLGQRGYCEFKIGQKTFLYHQIVAKYLVPNPKNGNKVFFNSLDKFDLKPQNLRWVWTREHQRFTPEQAIRRTKDRNLIAYYKTGNRRIIDSLVPDIFKKLYSIFGRQKVDELAGELFELIYNYLDRCLLFNLENDCIQTFRGLIKQKRREKIKFVELGYKL